jgi:hypothetical protein
MLHQGKTGNPDYLKTIQMLFDTQANFGLAVRRCGTMTEKRNVQFGAKNGREQIFQFFGKIIFVTVFRKRKPWHMLNLKDYTHMYMCRRPG